MNRLLLCCSACLLTMVVPGLDGPLAQERVGLSGALGQLLEEGIPDLLVRKEKGDEEKLLDPIIMIRGSWVTTMEDTIEHQAGDKTVLIDSSKMDTSQFGHREGFVLDNVELGVEGRHRKSGVYYRAKFELVPREKDGNPASGDYLRDAYAGWNGLSVLDWRIGRMKIPFSQANMKSTEHRWMVNSPVLDTLVPKRQVGTQLGLSDPWGIVALKGGVFNSTSLASEQLRDTEKLMWVGRGEFQGKRLLETLGLKLSWIDFKVGGSFASVKENYDVRTKHQWWGVDTHLRVGPVQVEAEYTVRDFYSVPLLDGSSTANHGVGWHVDLLVDLWPGVVDLAVRLEQMDGEEELVRGFSTTLSTDELVPQKKRWVTAGARLHISPEASLLLNYVYREELEGFSFDNDMFIAMF